MKILLKGLHIIINFRQITNEKFNNATEKLKLFAILNQYEIHFDCFAAQILLVQYNTAILSAVCGHDILYP